MATNKFFLTQVKRTNGDYEKGTVVKDTYEAALQSYHAYMGAYAYEHDPATDFVKCVITEQASEKILVNDNWNKAEPEPEI